MNEFEHISASEESCDIVVTLMAPTEGGPRQWRFESGESVAIGRDPTCEIRLNFPSISRRHATIGFEDGKWVYTNLGLNGSFINQKLIKTAALMTGTIVRLSKNAAKIGVEIVGAEADASPIGVEPGSVTQLMARASTGDESSVEKLWRRYFEQLAKVARNRLSGKFRRVTDDEDVASNVLMSLFDGFRNGRFPELNSRDGLWRLLIVMTQREVIKSVEHQKAAKRGGGDVRGDSINFSASGIESAGFDKFSASDITPDRICEMAEEAQRLLDFLNDDSLREVAQFKLQGYTNEEIAAELKCNSRTVQRKLQSVREIWGAVLFAASEEE